MAAAGYGIMRKPVLTTIVAACAAFPPSGAVLLTMLLALRRMRCHAE